MCQVVWEMVLGRCFKGFIWVIKVVGVCVVGCVLSSTNAFLYYRCRGTGPRAQWGRGTQQGRPQ